MNTLTHSFNLIEQHLDAGKSHHLLLPEKGHINSKALQPEYGLETPQRMRKHPTQDRSRMLVRSVRETVVDLAVKRTTGVALSIKTISERSGVGHGSLYQYFNGFESILASVYEDFLVNSLKRSNVAQQLSQKALIEKLLILDEKFDSALGINHYVPLVETSGSHGRTIATLLTTYRPWNAVESGSRPYWQSLFDE